MPEETARQEIIQLIEARRTELEIKIRQLTSELDQAQRKYNEFIDLLGKLREENSSSGDVQKHGSDDYPSMPLPQPTNSQIEAADSARSEDEGNNEAVNEAASEDIDTNEDKIEDLLENEEDNSSPKDWLHSQYQDRPMEDVILEILQQCQPAKPSDVALRIYQIGEDDPNFYRARNSANAALTNGKKAKKWKSLKRGVYVLNSYPETFQADLGQNGHHLLENHLAL